MKKIFSVMLCGVMFFGLIGCDGKESSPVTETSDRVIEEVKNSPSFEDVAVELEAEKPEITDKANIIIYKAKKSGSELHIAINEDGKLMGVQVIGDITDTSDEFIALVSAVSYISEFEIDSDTYSKIGEVISSQKEEEEIGNLIVGITVDGTTAKFSIALKDFADE